ncbi:MAG: hypothetical protein GX958_04875 [Desulfitobacterium sp.]|nr:hypothetical protein [Desulfitobacterium sp.]
MKSTKKQELEFYSKGMLRKKRRLGVNKTGIFSIFVFLIFEGIFLISLWDIIQVQQWHSLGLIALAIVTLVLPFIFTWLANRLKIQLPPGFQLFTLIYLFCTQYLGEIKGFYQSLWWWDLLLHGAFGVFGVILGTYLLKPHFERKEEVSARKYTVLIAIFAYAFSLASSTLWEIFEFVGDLIFPVKMVKGGLEDSLTDLILGAIGAALTSLIYYFKSRRSI